MTPSYLPFLILSAVSFIFLIILLHKNEWKLSNSLLGIFLTSVVFITIYFLKPSTISIGDLILRMEKIEDKLRPYVVLDIDGTSLEIVHTTFDKTDFEIINYSLEEGYISFLVKGNPEFINITPNGYNQFTIHPILERKVSGGVEYTAYWIKHSKISNDSLSKLLIEVVQHR